MLTFTHKQMQSFEEAAKANYKAHLIRLLKERHPGATPSAPASQSGDEWTLFIDKAVADAERKGFTAEAHIRIYSELLLLCGGSLNDHPRCDWIAETLAAPTLSSQIKANRLQLLIDEWAD